MTQRTAPAVRRPRAGASWLLVILAAPLVLAASACGLLDPDSTVGCIASYTGVEQVTTSQLVDQRIENAALLVRVEGRTVCRLFYGSYGPTTQVLTASAAKWLTAGAIMAVVDRGALRVDTRAGGLFPTAPPATADITVGQLLSHTSGLFAFSRCMGRSFTTLQACAQQALEGDLHFEPGTGFYYAGPAFTVAGAMAERAMDRSWADVFRTMIGAPLAMTHTSYGDSPNPALSEGEVVSTLDDYGRFAQMFLDDGMWNGRRVLSEDAIGALRRNWSVGVPYVFSPRGEVPYGLGVWLEALDATDHGTVISSPGIGGFVPLVDYDRRMVFVFVTRDEIDQVWPAVTTILSSVREAVDRER